MSRVPPVWRQGGFLHPQAISAVDISEDGLQIAAGTMAFRHDRNFWVLSQDGEILWSRHVAPWAPFQALALEKTCGAGLATSRVTGPQPTIAAFAGEKEPEFVMVDSGGELGFVRYGAGDWRTGWSASLLGDLFARGPGFAITVRHHDGSFRLGGDGTRTKFPLNHERPFRMTLSADGRLLALTGLVSADSRKGARAVLSLRDSVDGKELWNLKPLDTDGSVPKPPQPEDEFPTLPEYFDTRPDALVPFRVAASVSIGPDNRVALTEYQGWMRVRTRPASGRWDPPYHVLPFIPRQRGVLRLLEADGQELARQPLPAEGLFDVHADSAIWVSPLSWFSRGLSGCAWRPADDDARRIHRYDPEQKRWLAPLDFPDAVSDVAVQRGKALVSCWDGVVYAPDGGKTETGGPCRLRWSPDGRYAVAGSDRGDVWCLNPDATLRWRKTIPIAELPVLTSPPKPVFEELPVWQVGRTGQEHAYVGDTWLVKTARGGFLVDAGGTSAVPHTLQRIRAAGVDPKDLTHLVHTHSHGDHAGGGYLWRTMGLRVAAPETAAIALGWLIPTLSDYGVWPPRPVDDPLPLRRPGDEAEIDLAGVRVRAIFVPGHSMDSAIYALELGGRRLVFTGDIGFVDANNSNIVHRCWGDKARAKVVIGVVRDKVLPFKPDFVFTGHGAHRDGVKFLEELLRRSEAALGQ
jgi:glyoxylase-like metal-dependent hydrolase (beta-lactamase superfamily II)